MGTPEEDRRRLGELNALAAGHFADGRYEQAEPLFARVVAGCTAGLGADDPDTLISHGNLVVTRLRLDPRGPALGGLDANLAARRRVFGDQHPATVTAGRVRAVAYRRAQDDLRRMLAETTDAMGADHPDTVGLRAELAALADPDAPQGSDPATPPEPERGTSRVPPPRRPRGARFLREPPEPPDADAEDPATAPMPAVAHRPRGARFPRRS